MRKRDAWKSNRIVSRASPMFWRSNRMPLGFRFDDLGAMSLYLGMFPGSSRYNNPRSPRLISQVEFYRQNWHPNWWCLLLWFPFFCWPALKKIGELMWFSNFHIWPFDTLWTSFITYPGVGTGIFFPMKAPLPDPLVHSSGLGYVMLAWLRSVSEIRSKFVGFVLRLVMSIWTTHMCFPSKWRRANEEEGEHQLVFLWGVFHLYHGCFIHLGQVCAENHPWKSRWKFCPTIWWLFPQNPKM